MGGLVLLVLLCLVAGVALAQGGVSLRSWLIGGGGSTQTSSGGVSLASALGQAVAGRRSNGQVELQSGFWAGGGPSGPPEMHYVYVPVIPDAYYLLLPCGGSVVGYPDDPDDWYGIELAEAKTVTLQVVNFQANGDLLLYDDSFALIAQWGRWGSTMTIRDKWLAAGRYYVRVFAASGHNAEHAYTLSLTCQ